jgi:hypothetical protein
VLSAKPPSRMEKPSNKSLNTSKCTVSWFNRMIPFCFLLNIFSRDFAKTCQCIIQYTVYSAQKKKSFIGNGKQTNKQKNTAKSSLNYLRWFLSHVTNTFCNCVEIEKFSFLKVKVVAIERKM